MRDIKFRAWNKDIKKMFEVGQITLDKGLWDYQPDDRKHIGISIPYQPSFIIMQYTGLKDKNGKEIYEGDKVELDEEIGIIEWNNESSRFVIAFDTWATDFDHEYGKDLEIVGTIYDNADLLEKASD